MAKKKVKKKKLHCDNPCMNEIFGGCGSCPSSCHQPYHYYANQIKVGDKVDRVSKAYKFPGTVIARYTNSEGKVYVVVEMDKYKLQHIFRIEHVKRKEWNI